MFWGKCDKRRRTWRRSGRKTKCRNFSLWSTAINVYYTHKSPTMKLHGRKQRATLATQWQKEKQKNNNKKGKNIIKNKHYTDCLTRRRRSRRRGEQRLNVCEEIKQRPAKEMCNKRWKLHLAALRKGRVPWTASWLLVTGYSTLNWAF